MAKLKISLYSYLLVFLFSNSQVYAQWQTFDTKFNQNYWRVSVVNQNIIWVTGGSIIIKSTNSGLNWQIANTKYPRFSGSLISAVSENHAWITLDSLIYATTNGGQDWFQQNYSPKSYINEIHFFDQNTGIFLADPVRDTVGFFITRNGGLNWYRSPNSPLNPEYLTLGCMGVYDTSFVWFYNFTNVHGDMFYRLKNGLDNIWQSFRFPYIIGSWAEAVFKDTLDGLITDGHKVYRTTNGGINWFLRNDSSVNSNTNCFINVRNTNWVIITSGNRVRISYDWCSTWQPMIIKPYPPTYFGGLGSYDTNSIWMCGYGGLMYKYNYDYLGIKNITAAIPQEYKLYQNYPNPFNPVTKIKFDIPANSKQQISNVKLTIYDILGHEVTTLVNEALKPGTYEIDWDGSKFANGVYFYTLTTEDFSQTKLMLLVK